MHQLPHVGGIFFVNSISLTLNRGKRSRVWDLLWVPQWGIFGHSYCLKGFQPPLLKPMQPIRTYVIHLLRTYVTILCNWLILWQNVLYLYLGRSRMYLILQKTLFQVQVLKPCKSVQDSSVKSVVHQSLTMHLSRPVELFQLVARQQLDREGIYRGL